MIDILITIILTAAITTSIVRYIDKVYERVAILEAYLLGLDDAINHRLRKNTDEIIETTEQNIKNKIKGGYYK